jgi:hypothetical protein
MNIENGMPKTPGLKKAVAILKGSLASQERANAEPDEIHKMLCLSTAHVNPKTANLLDYGVHASVIAYQKSDNGYFMPVVGDFSSYPVDLFNVLAYARVRGCSWIMLDSDGPVVDGLPTWEW